MKKIIKNSSLKANIIIALISCCSMAWAMSPQTEDSIEKDRLRLEKIELGKKLYFDKGLSKNKTQSCATCHSPDKGFVDEREYELGAIVALGDDGKSRGDRNVPTASYAAFSPKFHFNEKKQEWVGGQFWDGRADNLAEQAGGPPLNPVEMNMPSKHAVIERIKQSPFYQTYFKKFYGEDILNNTDKAYDAMTDAIATFEESREFSPFDSKYDRFLRGEYELEIEEDLGMTLFFSNNNVSCSNCHKLFPEGNKRETFTDFRFKNIGTPKNETLIKMNNLGKNFVDLGLANNPKVKNDPNLAKLKGKFKTPTLRNVAVTGPYMHNGVFKHLRTVIEFYDSHNNPNRNINPETGKPWGKAEVPETIDIADLRAKKLTERKINALVAFMKILTDKRYEPLLEKLDQEEKEYWESKK